MKELKWAEGTRPIVQVLQKYEFPENIEICKELGIIRKRLAAQAVELANEAVASAIIEAAREAGISELYLIDKTFALEAIKEKLDRELKKLTVEAAELRKENAALREKIEREEEKE